MNYFLVKIYYSKDYSNWDNRDDTKYITTSRYDTIRLIKCDNFKNCQYFIERDKYFKEYKIDKIENLTIG